MSGIINRIGARSGIISGGSGSSAGTVTLSGTTGLNYEEGTWTPVTIVGTAGSNEGIYTKVGRLVHCTGTLNFASQTDSRVAAIYGLPYTIKDTSPNRPTGSVFYTSYYADQILILGNQNAVHIDLYKVVASTGVTHLSYTNMSGRRFDFDFTYFVKN